MAEAYRYYLLHLTSDIRKGSENMQQNETLSAIVKCLDRKKAEDIKVLKITELTILADYFVIADGMSNTQTRALADEVEVKLKELGLPPNQIQGTAGCGWVILDYGDIVVHIFNREQRDFYNLERLWADGEEIDISEWTAEQ